jgi:uncharacterized protein YjiS (DUF1127 family)
MTAISAQDGAKPASTGLFQTIGHAFGDLLGRYQRRQTMHQLSALDDHLLEDIGVRRSELAATTMSDGSTTRRDLQVPRHHIG